MDMIRLIVVLVLQFTVVSCLRCYWCSGVGEDRACEMHPHNVSTGPGSLECKSTYCTSTQVVDVVSGQVKSFARICDNMSRGNFCYKDNRHLTCYETCTTDLCNHGNWINGLQNQNMYHSDLSMHRKDIHYDLKSMPKHMNSVSHVGRTTHKKDIHDHESVPKHRNSVSHVGRTTHRKDIHDHKSVPNHRNSVSHALRTTHRKDAIINGLGLYKDKHDVYDKGISTHRQDAYNNGMSKNKNNVYPRGMPIHTQNVHGQGWLNQRQNVHGQGWLNQGNNMYNKEIASHRNNVYSQGNVMSKHRNNVYSQGNVMPKPRNNVYSQGNVMSKHRNNVYSQGNVMSNRRNNVYHRSLPMKRSDIYGRRLPKQKKDMYPNRGMSIQRIHDNNRHGQVYSKRRNNVNPRGVSKTRNDFYHNGMSMYRKVMYGQNEPKYKNDIYHRGIPMARKNRYYRDNLSMQGRNAYNGDLARYRNNVIHGQLSNDRNNLHYSGLSRHGAANYADKRFQSLSRVRGDNKHNVFKTSWKSKASDAKGLENKWFNKSEGKKGAVGMVGESYIVLVDEDNDDNYTYLDDVVDDKIDDDNQVQNQKGGGDDNHSAVKAVANNNKIRKNGEDDSDDGDSDGEKNNINKAADVLRDRDISVISSNSVVTEDNIKYPSEEKAIKWRRSRGDTGYYDPDQEDYTLKLFSGDLYENDFDDIYNDYNENDNIVSKNIIVLPVLDTSNDKDRRNVIRKGTSDKNDKETTGVGVVDHHYEYDRGFETEDAILRNAPEPILLKSFTYTENIVPQTSINYIPKSIPFSNSAAARHETQEEMIDELNEPSTTTGVRAPSTATGVTTPDDDARTGFSIGRFGQQSSYSAQDKKEIVGYPNHFTSSTVIKSVSTNNQNVNNIINGSNNSSDLKAATKKSTASKKQGFDERGFLKWLMGVLKAEEIGYFESKDDTMSRLYPHLYDQPLYEVDTENLDSFDLPKTMRNYDIFIDEMDLDKGKGMALHEKISHGVKHIPSYEDTSIGYNDNKQSPHKKKMNQSLTGIISFLDEIYSQKNEPLNTVLESESQLGSRLERLNDIFVNTTSKETATKIEDRYSIYPYKLEKNEHEMLTKIRRSILRDRMTISNDSPGQIPFDILPLDNSNVRTEDDSLEPKQDRQSTSYIKSKVSSLEPKQVRRSPSDNWSVESMPGVNQRDERKEETVDDDKHNSHLRDDINLSTYFYHPSSVTYSNGLFSPPKQQVEFDTTEDKILTNSTINPAVYQNSTTTISSDLQNTEITSTSETSNNSLEPAVNNLEINKSNIADGISLDALLDNESQNSTSQDRNASLTNSSTEVMIENNDTIITNEQPVNESQENYFVEIDETTPEDDKTTLVIPVIDESSQGHFNIDPIKRAKQRLLLLESSIPHKIKKNNHRTSEGIPSATHTSKLKNMDKFSVNTPGIATKRIKIASYDGDNKNILKDNRLMYKKPDKELNSSNKNVSSGSKHTEIEDKTTNPINTTQANSGRKYSGYIPILKKYFVHHAKGKKNSVKNKTTPMSNYTITLSKGSPVFYMSRTGIDKRTANPQNSANFRKPNSILIVSLSSISLLLLSVCI